MRFHRVVVKSQALTSDPFRTTQGIGKAVQRTLIGGENHSMIQQRRIFGGAPPHSLFPKLNRSTPFLLPTRVQIYDHVHPAPPVFLVMMHAEVGVHVEKTAST